jgi:DNA-binding SARP family transcriptional activator
MGDIVRRRCEELTTLYADGTVAAGEAALRLGKAKLAVRYGLEAHRVQDLREDAVILLVRAYKASGRTFEISRLYRSFSRHLIEAQGVPPSLSLRRVVELALGSGAPGGEGMSGTDRTA